MSDIVIREVTPAITIFSKPFARFHIFPFGGRSTAVKLENGSSPPLPSDYKKEYPAAKVVGVEPLEAKKKDVLTFDGLYGKDAPNTTYGFEPEYSKSKASSKVPFFGTFGPHGKVHKYFLWSQSEDKRAMERDAQTVAQWDFERVIMCHGDVIEKDGNAVWREAYKWFLEGKP
ncbi:hypothetical protein BOTBODRAFT_53463 [Botryobasidium botryosum FD-172 SS1]|uniref:Uncharacterized protein n=1 Tax=Botryobasidium botryosum (strain FD-172 SS1) TaxID=930990 RepID=A0A067MRP2_BOTB1|nr:hypothetical protein BOTBODRAFT_53463 [Botryobasidium botryosum FD-172 SS1]